MITRREQLIKQLKEELENQSFSIYYSSPSLKRAKCFYIKESSSSIQKEFDSFVALLDPSPETPEQKEVLQVAPTEIEAPDPMEPPHDEPPQITTHNEPNKRTVSPQAPHDANVTSATSDPSFSTDTSVNASSVASQGSERSGKDDDAIDYSNMTKKAIKKMQKDQLREKKAFDKVRSEAHKRGYDTSLLQQFDDPEELYNLTDDEIDQIQAAGIVNEDGFYSFVYPADAKTFKKKSYMSKEKLIFLSVLVGISIFLVILLVRNILGIFN